MEEQKTEKRYISVGLLAHVDAGKTTLAERMLYQGGSIRKLGRVDHGDAFLDHNVQERERGITIFASQAQCAIGDKLFTFLDTPGHTDFSAEMERTLQVLDYAILVISGTDGVQGHVYTLWKLLKRHKVPVFLFINKMDLAVGREEAVLQELQQKLGEGLVDFRFPESEGFMEGVAMCEEALLEQYLEQGFVEKNQIRRLIT